MSTTSTLPSSAVTRRIVLITNHLKGSGAERFVITLANTLQAQGHDSHIICFSHLQELPSAQALKIHIFPMQRWRWLPRAWRGKMISRLLDRFIEHKVGCPDLVLSNLLTVDRLMTHSHLPNVHLVIHSTLSQEVLKNATVKKRQSIEAIYARKPCICVSQGVLQDFQRLFPAHATVQHIYNPVDVEFVRQSANQANPINLPNYLVHVGKFNDAKRHDRLLRAYADSGAKLPLVLVGKGKLMTDNQQLAQDLGVADQVVFAGFHSNPYPIIAGATGMILSSDFEGLSLVILEALALDVPVISTDCPSGPNEILPAENLVPIADEALLATKIKELSLQADSFKTPLKKQFLPDTAAQHYLGLIEKSNH